MAEKPTEEILSPQQQRFVDEYLIDLNATQAAIRAGYSIKGASVRGTQLLAIARIKDAIEAKRARLQVRTEISTDKVLKEIARIAFADMRRAAKWSADEVIFTSSDEIDDDTAACISEINSTTTHGPGGKKVQMKVKFYDKMRAIEMLSKHLSLLATGEDNKSIPLTPDNIAELCRAAREQKPD
jgi:phage terminase small subunit